MLKTKTPQKIFRTEELKKHHHRCCILLIFIIIAACGNNRRPGLSDKDLFAQREVSDMEIFVVAPGIKYTESRAVDPAQPPVVIDIANRKLNIRKFNLSDYYTKVRYIKLKHPKSATKGTFLLDYRTSYISAMGKEWERRDFIMGRSIFKFTDDYIVAGDACFGLHCYDKEGKFLYTIESNDFPKTYDASQSSVSFAAPDVKGFYGRITAHGNNCLYCVMEDYRSRLCLYDLTQKKRIVTRPFEGRVLILDDNSIASYVYHPVNAPDNFLFTLDLMGDTLCQFRSYNPIPEIRGNYLNPPIPDIYYYDKQLTIRQTLNDTVYRMVSPNRLLPTYVLNFGPYRIDVQTYLFGVDLSEVNLVGVKSEKLFPYKWRETDRYILFIYTLIHDFKNNSGGESVTFFYSYFDKKSRQLYHFSEGAAVPDNQFFMENSIPEALPFILSHAEIGDRQLHVVYSKKRLEDIIKSRRFASFPLEQRNKLRMLHHELDDSEVLIMILE